MSPRAPTAARERAGCALAHPAPPCVRSAQTWLHAAITAAEAPDDAATMLVPGHLPAATRLGVYRHAYRARLEECLADDYPALRALIGERRFAGLCAAAIVAHPPREPTLNRYGRFLPAFLAGRAGLPAAAADLARLEWALVEAIHSPCGAAPDPDALARLRPERLAGARFRADPSLRVVISRWAIDESLAEHQRSGTCPAPRRRRSAVAVRRRPAGLRREPLDPDWAHLLHGLANGETLAAAIAAVPGRRITPTALTDCFRRWFAGGLLVGVDP